LRFLSDALVLVPGSVNLPSPPPVPSQRFPLVLSSTSWLLSQRVCVSLADFVILPICFAARVCVSFPFSPPGPPFFPCPLFSSVLASWIYPSPWKILDIPEAFHSHPPADFPVFFPPALRQDVSLSDIIFRSEFALLI